MSVHYEFIDNDVPYGARPRTAAFGRAGELNVLDVRRLLDVERYGKINVDATGPQQVYPGPQAMAAASNTEFLVRCARELPAVNFADRETGRVYARVESGRLAWTEPEALERAVADPETRTGLVAVAPEALSDARRVSGPRRLAELAPGGRAYTLGRWGEAAG
jgi:hypothetical protein